MLRTEPYTASRPPSPLLSSPPSGCTLGIKAAFVKYRQMSPRCAGPGAEASSARRKPRHQQGKLLMRNAQDIHGRGNHSKRLDLNYIFSDCKLLLTASLPSLQLTFLTKGHLLTSTRRLPGGVWASRRKGWHGRVLGRPGSQARPRRAEREKRPLMLARRADVRGGRLKPT